MTAVQRFICIVLVVAVTTIGSGPLLGLVYSQSGSLMSPPRFGKAGNTGTYLIVFKNGAVVTLEKVSLVWLHLPGEATRKPSFEAHYRMGSEPISWRGGGRRHLNPDDIVAIFRLDEDFNTP